MILAEADPVYMISQIGHKSVRQSYEYASNTQENREKNKGKVMDTIKDIIWSKRLKLGFLWQICG